VTNINGLTKSGTLNDELSGLHSRDSTVQRCQVVNRNTIPCLDSRHENKKHEPSWRLIAHAVFNIGRREHDLIRPRSTLMSPMWNRPVPSITK